jgi:L-alanine-DL-glutamate epimerase-like enolase superfamily enzyme
VVAKIETDDGLAGYGEGAGIGFVTGETAATVVGAIEAFTPLLVGQSPYAIDHLHRAMDRLMVRNGSAKAAVDLALYDLMAKAAGLPLYRFLGGVENTVETDMTIGIQTPAAMAARAADLVAAGFRHLKIKAGDDADLDRAAITAIRAAVPDARLKVDANQGWTARQALAMLEHYAGAGVESVEQPLPFWDLDGMADLRARSPIAIMADESCFTPQDASAIVRRQAADQINIKLMKCGGLYRALQIDAIAEAAGIPTMVGCMLESRLGIAAGAHFAAARPNVLYADLDSFRDFDDSALVQDAFGFTPPLITLTDAPGLGVDLAF